MVFQNSTHRFINNDTKIKLMTEIIVDIEGLTNLTSDSRVLITLGDTTYEFKPISLKVFTKYERLSKDNDDTDGKAFLLHACSVDPVFTIEEAEDLPAGKGAILATNLLKASFLMLPASNE